MLEKMLFDMIGISKDEAQEYVKNALQSFQNFEQAISSIANDVKKIKAHLGIDDDASGQIIEMVPEKKDGTNG